MAAAPRATSHHETTVASTRPAAPATTKLASAAASTCRGVARAPAIQSLAAVTTVPSVREQICRESMGHRSRVSPSSAESGQRPLGGGDDRLYPLAAEARSGPGGTAPDVAGLTPEVPADPVAVEHVDALDSHDHPRRVGPVHHHRRADLDRLAEFVLDQPLRI